MNAPDDAQDTEHQPTDPIEVFPESEIDLRGGTDACYKCSACDSSCPVAEVDDDFPGPKFQGPEQWRLSRKDERTFDDSIMNCSNCMRCEAACPTGVPLSQMHNEARAAYVNDQMSRLSRRYWRNRLLANYRRIGALASRVPRLANFVLGNRLTKWVNKRFLGITAEREFPKFAHETFREWYAARGGLEESRRRAAEGNEAERNDGESDNSVRDKRESSKGESSKGESSKRESSKSESDDAKRVAYFHGCYANYNTPEVAKALVRVYESLGYEVAVPAQGCSGTPMFANGMLADARRDAETNVSSLSSMLDEGYDIVCSCTSCSMSLRQEYPELFAMADVDRVAANTYDALEYLRIHENIIDELAAAEDAGAGDVSERRFAYHAPCHARNQGLDRQARELFASLDTIGVEDVGESCSGISGTYGWKAEKYENSIAIGAEMFEEMEAATGETGLTECPTCAMQMEHGTGYEVRHPLEILETILVD